ncbi:GyrI-like domain-containing protein [Mucilaginibacter phyllosphaerae]|uniref:AraC family transcriptional regulator n=1 Tax=Mucilaginibacter phyllosphaerae TaxID=1812349 RepID=A0A4Y8ACU6_9SPHI|nr:GyrI-like domain-containing protein [Mucilaginibacter phyllosphaerae]MBB3970047.1 AraC family transcriptional regulator [Mucilaginibacter phyllosphaerae]TEW66440.1 AraC family transcriptional regulator [Mucilaginibacter phyllosphaerae]GGH09422.1 hypothetical protein GCM10007352_14800 [Mucilaginibacter phyllosphaerae]
MEPRIASLPHKKLIGQQVSMSLTANKTHSLFSGFMPRRHEVGHKLNTTVICMQVFEPGFDFRNFTPATVHQKWAAVEVAEFDDVPAGMETFELAAGLYAVFAYKGTAATFGPTYNYIFNTWLPSSVYELDNRPHFEVLGDKYKNNDPESEEDIYVPVRLKSI